MTLRYMNERRLHVARLIAFIKGFIDEGPDVFESLTRSLSVMKKSLADAEKHMKDLPLLFTVSSEYSSQELLEKWKAFKEKTDSAKIGGALGRMEASQLIFRTSRYFDNITNVPISHRYSTGRRISPNNALSSELDKLAEENEKISKQLSKETAKDNPNEEVVSTLNSMQESNKQKILELHEQNAERAVEQLKKDDFETKLAEAFACFQDLSRDMERERESYSTEYRFFVVLMTVPLVGAVIWVTKFMEFLFNCGNQIHSWFEIVPYYVPISLMIAVFWVSLVQKNRADRNREQLSEKLHGIHYLEGLLMMINRMPTPSVDNMKRINDLVDKIAAQYLAQAREHQKDPVDSNNDQLLPVMEKLDHITDTIAKVIKK